MVQSHVGAVHWIIVSSLFSLPCGLWVFLWRVTSMTSSAQGLWSWPCDLLGQWDISGCDMKRGFKYAHVGRSGSFPYGMGMRRAALDIL